MSNFLTTSIGKKVIMSLSGLFSDFVFVHSLIGESAVTCRPGRLQRGM